MSPLMNRVNALVFFHPWLKWIALPLAALAVVGVVLGDPPPPPSPAITAINLAAEPLYARGNRAKPTLTLALSVEFPTVGAQYLSTPGATADATYSPSIAYIGYFDSEGCYTYNDTPSDGTPTADYKRFDRSKDATAHACGGDSFSGNFMNWASSSAIDILRYGLTGGDRIVDTATLTVLQRAVLPNTNVATTFWNDRNFPDKQVSGTNATSALPTALLNGYTGTVHIANCLNRIHFGTAATGSCANPGDNSKLGAAQLTGPVTDYSGTLPGSFSSSACAGENGTCSFTGIRQIAYGTGTRWKFMSASNGASCSNGVFGDPAPGSGKSCYTRSDPTGWSPSTTGGTLTTDNYFYVRASVCKSTTGTLDEPRPALCLRYPNGNYKPIGNLQKNSDRLRVAAFGYLNDNAGNPNERYGGVLRAPMKYVGPTSYDANFSLISGANPNQEWDTNTGVFVANPDANSSIRSGPTNTGPYLSGVTNYLNQFGRTGTIGQYKGYDPVGELYYESLRYLQGLPPTPQATYGMTTAMQDGFPVTTSWTDPHPAVANLSASSVSDYSCVRNSIVAIGDDNTHNDKSFPGNTTRLTNESVANIGFPSGRPANTAGNEPDFYYWTKVVGGFESNTSVQYPDGTGASRYTANFNPANSARAGMETQNVGQDGASYFMAGAAYWANTHDIRGADWTSYTGADPRRPGMRVTTYMLDVNEFAAQNDASTRHNNQFFLAAKYGGFTDVTGTGTPYKATDLTDSNANWQDPANPGEARTYYLSSSAANVLAALDNIFANAAKQANSIAGGAISTSRLTTTTGAIYQAQFDPSAWSGDLAAYAVTADVSGNVAADTVARWQASVELDVKAALTSPAGGSRNIVIGKTTPTSSATATDFLWNTALDADVKTALKTPPYSASASAAGSDPDTTGQARLNYLRGDRSNEAPNGLLMRKRAGILGDIVNSGVAFSGAPSQDIVDSGYSTFYTDNVSRKHALFVGSNDGMLHAFDPDHGSGNASTHFGGDELFAYIPSWLIPKLAALTSPSYVHQSYVDATPVVAEARVAGSWMTVLVGGSGGGGQGVYALDVTRPEAFNAGKVLWEFTDRDDADLGNVIGRPQILKVRTNATSAAPVYQYFAVVASGVNNYVGDGHYSLTGGPAIFLLDLGKPKGTSWSLGSNYFKISFPTSTSATGIVGFTARLDNANALSTLYAGDLQGNLWKLDFSQATGGTTDWSVPSTALDKLSYFHSSSNAALPMFITGTSATGTQPAVTQPITMEPALVFGPNRTIIVSFGTGKFLEVGDNTITGAPQQSVYAILDNNTTALDSTGTPSAAISGQKRLVMGNVGGGGGAVTVPAFTWGRATAEVSSTAGGVASGWYFNFGNAGERQISDFAVLAGRLIFGSVIPAASSCDSGKGNLYQVTVGTGNATITQSTVGILGEPLIAQVGVSTTTSTNTTGLRKENAKYQIILQGASGLSTSLPPQSIDTYSGRLSWREISNYQQLRHN